MPPTWQGRLEKFAKTIQTRGSSQAIPIERPFPLAASHQYAARAVPHANHSSDSRLPTRPRSSRDSGVHNRCKQLGNQLIRVPPQGIHFPASPFQKYVNAMGTASGLVRSHTCACRARCVPSSPSFGGGLRASGWKYAQECVRHSLPHPLPQLFPACGRVAPHGPHVRQSLLKSLSESWT